jgi:hypothetical protein
MRQRSKTESSRFLLSLEALTHSIERNFNGVGSSDLRQVAACFLKPLPIKLPIDDLESSFRQPTVVLKDALCRASSFSGHLNRPRFKLIIDYTEDDSILRLLKAGSVTEISRNSLFKLSHLPEECEHERLRLISGVKFAALQGNLAVLSQTDVINESFYDLFNQRYREVSGRDGEVRLFTNIASGGVSRRSQVQEHFECVVHVRESNMSEVPAPFLNRFEKYRLTLGDILTSGWSRFGAMHRIVLRAKKRTSEIASSLRVSTGFFDWMDREQTLDSIFVNMLPHLDGRLWDSGIFNLSDFSKTSDRFVDMIASFLQQFTSLPDISGHLDYALNMAQRTMSVDSAGMLKGLMNKESNPRALQESLRSILAGGSEKTDITNLAETLIQMVVTRAASFRLIQLATPEAIFANR